MTIKFKIRINLKYLNVCQIKERVVQAVTGGVSKSAQNSTIGNSSVIPTSPTLFPASNINPTNSLWNNCMVDTSHFQQSNIAAIPIASQENLLLYDLLYCLTGMKGSYIIPDESTINSDGGIKFKISDQLHTSLRDIAQEILPLATHYTCVQKFIEKASFTHCGQVLQALSAALRDLTHDYFVSTLCIIQSS